MKSVLFVFWGLVLLLDGVQTVGAGAVAQPDPDDPPRSNWNPCKLCSYCEACEYCELCPCTDKPNCKYCSYCPACKFCSFCNVCHGSGWAATLARASGHVADKLAGTLDFFLKRRADQLPYDEFDSVLQRERRRRQQREEAAAFAEGRATARTLAAKDLETEQDRALRQEIKEDMGNYAVRHLELARKKQREQHDEL